MDCVGWDRGDNPKVHGHGWVWGRGDGSATKRRWAALAE